MSTALVGAGVFLAVGGSTLVGVAVGVLWAAAGSTYVLKPKSTGKPSVAPRAFHCVATVSNQ